MRAAALALFSLAAALALCEGALWALERSASAPLPQVDVLGAPAPPELPAALRDKIARMQSAFVMPREWDHIELEQRPGVRRPYRWHGAVHVFDAQRMRRDGPFPPHDPTRFRVIVLGDSFTYGEGIDAQWTYSAQLERALAADFRIEVLNLGVLGYQSADVVHAARALLPQLAPDLVVYGVCPNDFREAGAVEPRKSTVPLPEKWKKALVRRTRLGRLAAERYQALLLRLGVRREFYRDVEEDFEARRARFARDVAELNAFVVASGRPPVVALVLDHLALPGAGRALAEAAEAALRDAGAEVIPSDELFELFRGRNFRVSRWEAHPNEEAHALWADRLARALRPRADLARFRRG